MSFRRSLLIAAFSSSLLVLAAACSDEEGGEDPLPITPTRCAIYWARENTADDPPSLDFFTVDQPLSAWTTGTDGSYGGGAGAEREGIFAYRSPDGSVSLAESVGVTTGGDFALTIEGIAAGDDVGFSDAVGQSLVDGRVITNPPGVGTGGAGNFTGVWSALEAQSASEIDWASSATMTIVYLGSSITLGGSELGGMSAYAQCYDAAAAFAPAPVQGGKVFHAVQNSMVSSGTRPGKGSR